MKTRFKNSSFLKLGDKLSLKKLDKQKSNV